MKKEIAEDSDLSKENYQKIISLSKLNQIESFSYDKKFDIIARSMNEMFNGIT